MTRRIYRLHVACVILALLFCLPTFGDEPAPRAPAPVMTFHGAEWLERPEREQEEMPAEVIKTMGLKPGDVVADIGCGTGYFTRRMAKAVAPDGKVYANDIQPEFIEMLKVNCAKEGITNFEPILGAEDDPKLPKGGIDWILLTDVYHEFQQPKPMLARMLESLKPDGKVALIEYRLLGDTAAHIKKEHRMSVKQVLAEWNEAGFELVDLQEFLPSQHFFIFKRDPDRTK
ncbi:MAG: methyltransferase domain-containing protein [Candidatus Hydrogenedentes bacterium]|nr:methyltransferase domain-containing protein [Candidatus Hydrogenedentota bacterium]